VQGVILFEVGSQKWTLDLSSGAGSLKQGEEGAPDLTLTMTDENFAKLVSGKLNPQQAFLFRKLKIKGSMAKAMKVSPVLEAARASTSKL
jgi:putative sterol carrier protein